MLRTAPALGCLLCGLALTGCRAREKPTEAADTDEVDSGQPVDTGPSQDTASEDTADTADTADTGGAEDTGPEDADGDGYDVTLDCDDADATVYPGARELCADGVVNDCDGDPDAATTWCTETTSSADTRASWSRSDTYSSEMRPGGVGDLNGDGFDDVIMGDPWTSEWIDWGEYGPSLSGAVHVFYGPLSGAYDWDDARQTIYGTSELNYLGWDSVPLGDTDGDGYDDFAVGAAGERGGDNPVVYRIDGPAAIEYIDEATVLAYAATTSDCAGATLAAMADRDGDGARDLLVGDQCVGVVHLISTGASTEEALGTIDLATFVGSSEASRFGRSLASGDLDGDGLPDVAIGAPDYTFTADAVGLGWVSVFSGEATGTLTEDDADTVVVAVESDTLPTTIGGHYRVMLGSSAAIADLDGDGYDDLAAGAVRRNDDTVPGGGQPSDDEGAVLVYYGPLEAQLGIPDADFALVGDEGNTRVGGETTADWDLDGDGHLDLLVGTGWQEWRGGGNSASAGSKNVWVVFGPMSTGTRLASSADVIFTDDAGMTSGMAGVQARVAGDTDGDGRAEIFMADWGEWVGLFALPTDGY